MKWIVYSDGLLVQYKDVFCWLLGNLQQYKQRIDLIGQLQMVNLYI